MDKLMPEIETDINQKRSEKIELQKEKEIREYLVNSASKLIDDFTVVLNDLEQVDNREAEPKTKLKIKYKSHLLRLTKDRNLVIAKGRFPNNSTIDEIKASENVVLDVKPNKIYISGEPLVEEKEGKVYKEGLLLSNIETVKKEIDSLISKIEKHIN